MDRLYANFNNDYYSTFLYWYHKMYDLFAESIQNFYVKDHLRTYTLVLLISIVADSYVVYVISNVVGSKGYTNYRDKMVGNCYY